MTFRQRIERDYPEHIDSGYLGGIEACPHNYGYESFNNSPCKGHFNYVCENACRACWDREIPGTEPLTYEHTGEPIGKVTDITEDENGVTATIKKEKNMATKKTKSELMEELEYIKEAKAELENELKKLEKYKQYEEMADELKAMHTAFMNAGFSNEQAYDMVKTMTISMMPTVLKNLTRN